MKRGEARAGALLSVAFACAACASDSSDTGPGAHASTVADCKETYPASTYGYGEPSGIAGSPAPGADAGPPPTPPPRTPPEVEASEECDSAGSDGPDTAEACDIDRFMSVDAALCIARADGMVEGLRGLRGSLVYNARHRRVIYSVQNTLEEGAGSAGGSILAIDAITGEILDRGGWASQS